MLNIQCRGRWFESCQRQKLAFYFKSVHGFLYIFLFVFTVSLRACLPAYHAYMPSCLHVYLPACISAACVPVCLFFASVCVSLSVCRLPACQSVYLSVCLSVCLSVSLSVCLFMSEVTELEVTRQTSVCLKSDFGTSWQ
jgi:hypothetical protein